MIGRKVLRNNVRSILRYCLTSGLISSLLTGALFLAGMIRGRGRVLPDLAMFAGIGFLFGFLIPLLVQLLFDIILAQRRVRRLPYLSRIGLLVLLIAVAMLAVYLGFGLLLFRRAMWSFGMLGFVGLMTAVVAMAGSLHNSITEFLGTAFFRDIISGKYYTAREERVIILFVDLSGSTSFAETLPAAWFFQLLNDFLYIVEQSVHYHGGTVYKYLGDGLIAYWPAAPANYAKSREAMRDILAELAEQREALATKYWRTLECTAGLHCGPVLIGELGTMRKEIGLWGDTVNTAQRIQSACRTYGVPLLCSLEYLARLRETQPGAAMPAKLFENVALRGKQKPMTLAAPE
jgi:adenylate cyclase